MDQIENVKSVYGLWPCCPLLLLLPVYGLHRLLVVQEQQQQQEQEEEEAQQGEPSCRLSRSRRLARRGFDSAARLSYDTISSAKATLWRFPPYLIPLPCPVELSRSDACNMLLQLVVAAANLGLHLLRFLPSLDVVPPSTVSR